MLRMDQEVFERLQATCENEPPQGPRIPEYFGFFDVGRKAVYQSNDTLVLFEPSESLQVGYGVLFSLQMPTAPLLYQGLAVRNGQALCDIARALYLERDPLESADSAVADVLWDYVAILVEETVTAWLCSHPDVFAELKDIEALARRENVPVERVRFFPSLDIDALIAKRVPRNNALTAVFRNHVAGRSHAEYCAWLAEQPQLFDVLEREAGDCEEHGGVGGNPVVEGGC